MPITRTQACLRLIALHCHRCVDDPSFAARVSLRDLLRPEVIEAVVRQNLLVELEPGPPLAPTLRELIQGRLQ